MVVELIVFIVVVAVNVNWYRIKYEIKEMGMPVSWWYNHLQDFSSLDSLAKSKEIAVSEKAKALRVRLYVGVFSFVAAMIGLFTFSGN